MLKNNNGAILTRMAKRSLAGNKSRYGIIFFAILLSAFMLFTVLTVGVTWFQMQKIQNIRMRGADYDVMLYGGFTEEQLKACEENRDVAAVGAEGFGAWALSTDRDTSLHSTLVWADENKWEKMQQAAREWTRGRYPKKDYEVMATKAALKDCGYEELDIGDSFTLTYEDNTGSHTAEFTISGMWDGYGDKKVFYVAKSFFEHTGFTSEDYGRGFLYIKFKPALVTGKMRRQLEEDLILGERQVLLYGTETESSMRILIGMTGVIAVTCLCAYLLIYNIMYLSVSGNIRCYGLLQTVGMTGRQIYRLVQRQMMFVGTIGIGGGILLGAAASFFVIPGVVKTFGIREEDVRIVFHPMIFLFSILVAALTVYLGSRKPARIATKISPVEALGYQTVWGKQTTQKSGKGSLAGRLARNQIRKDKKKTIVVVLSLGVCLSVFLCLVTLIESQGARSIVSNYMEADLVLKNDSMTMEEQDKWRPLMDASFLQELEGEGIKEIYPMYQAQIVIPWGSEFMDMWMTKFYDTYMGESYEDIVDDYRAHPENYGSFLTGITLQEFEYLNAALGEPLNGAEFQEGKACILYGSDLNLETEEVIGQNIEFALFGEPKTIYDIQIAGITDDIYYGNMPGAAPTLLVSDTFLKRIAKEPGVSKVSVIYDKEYDKEQEERIKAMMQKTDGGKDFSYDSKLEEMEDVRKSQGNMMGIGAGITLILAVIGILNYVNTVSGNIQSRQVEIAVMESVGMTGRQVKKLLVLEGLLYAAFSLFIAATAGLGVTYYLYQSMNYRGIPFRIPLVPSLCMTLCVLLICVSIPLLSYRILVGKKSVIERIRRKE
jgi:putative ABC transport system permease protein